MLLLAIGLRPSSIEKLERGGEFWAGDPEPEVVRRFFTEAALPYEDRFVSIGCFCEATGLETLKRYYATPGGRVAILDNSRVICDIAVAAPDDIQELASRAWKERCINECASKFVWPSTTPVRIEDALLRAATCATQYAEARLYRPLVKQDILRWV